MRNYVTVLIIVISMTSCNSGKEKINPVKESITESIYASGVVKSINQYQVYAPVNGLIQEILVKEGDTVRQGDVIGRVGNTGNSAANHLHLTIVTPDGRYVNPYDLFLIAGITPIRARNNG